MAKNKPHSTAQLLVEGNDDFHVMHSLFFKANIPVNSKENLTGKFSIEDCKGIEGVLAVIPILLKTLDIVGAVIDADTQIESQWQRIRDILANSGFTPPEHIPKEGLILETSSKKIGIWLMPNNEVNGMLEDFIRFLIPDNDDLLPIVQNTITEIENKKLNRHNIIHRPKTLIHNWLSLQPEPGTPLGQAITKRYLSTENKEIHDRFIKWINALFIN